MTEQWIIDNQIYLRVVFFLLGLGIFGAWETRKAWRQWWSTRWQRWVKHLSLGVVSQLCIKLVFPIMAVGVAIVIESKHIGILNQISMPYVLKVMLGVLCMDLAIYWQHRIMHKYALLWRFHRVHHMDREVDVTTGVRFHPLEVMFTLGVKIVAVGFFGVNVLAVIMYEILLNLALLFTHVNVRLKPTIEKRLRRYIVTPGMHRIHHSDTPRETNSNYGFCLSGWDKLFNTYTLSAKTGETKLVIGLEEYRDPKFQTFENMLLVPFNVKHLKHRYKRPPKLAFQTDKNVLFRAKVEPSDREGSV